MTKRVTSYWAYDTGTEDWPDELYRDGQIHNWAMILVAGALLLTPGFFTDAFGFLLLFPPFRRWAFQWAKSRVKFQTFEMGAVHPQTGAPRAPDTGDVIDADYSEIGNPDAPGNSGWTKH